MKSLWVGVLILFVAFLVSPVFGQSPSNSTIPVTVLDDYINQTGDVVIIVQIDGGNHILGLGCDPKDTTCARPVAGEKGLGARWERGGVYKGVNYLFKWEGGPSGVYGLVVSK
ncbi:MAG: hypothetical protein WA651_13415 [Candidatus Sulfotelmatobacter sp.]